jgi:ubiquinone/menaquinone biosynthesis C-methylase UbiE
MALRDMYGRRPRKRPGEAAVTRRAMLRIPRTAAAARDVDYDSANERVRRGWDSESHAEFLRQLAPVGDLLADLCSLAPGQRLLDVGAGDGNAALAAAARGARVDACDLSARMVERGERRSLEQGLDVRWRVADAQALPYADAWYDVVQSAFGAAPAPRPVRTARELVRVTRPGGFVALAAWSPRGLPGALDELVEPVGARPVGVPRPSAWGTEAVARRRFDGLLEEVEVRTRTLRLSFASAEEAFDTLVRPYLRGPGERDALRPEFDRVLASCNDRPPRAEIAARYLVVSGRATGSG